MTPFTMIAFRTFLAGGKSMSALISISLDDVSLYFPAVFAVNYFRWNKKRYINTFQTCSVCDYTTRKQSQI